MSIDPYGQDVEINVTMKTKGFETAKSNIQSVKEETKDSTKEIEKASSGYRMLSRDLMMVGRSVSMINRIFLGNNETIKQMTGLLYGAVAVLRMVTAAEHLMEIASKSATFAHIIETAALWAKAQALMVVHALTPMGWLTLGIAAGVGALALSGKMRSMQGGGVVSYTGPHYLHAGETVIPRGEQTPSNYSQINIDMKTGPIANYLDVEDMLINMSDKIAQASRRRAGHG